MEVLKIDWENIDSRFVRDDAYEGINAPKWMDFLAPEDPTDDESFFCRPDCKHLKSPSDFNFLRSSSKFKNDRQTRASLVRSSSKSEAATPLREMNGRELRSKSRVLVSSSVTSLAELRSPKKTKAPHHQTPFPEAECENKNPNSPASVNSARKGKCTTEFKVEKQVQRQNLVQRPTVAMKERKSEKPEPETPTKPPPLRSAHSARNLFAGRDILSQISEFCTELKKLALNGNRAAGLPVKPETAKPTTPANERSGKERSGVGTAAGSSSTDENQRKKPLNSSRKDRGENNNKKVEEKVGGQRPEWKITGKVNGRSSSSSSSNGVRSAPPTPQKFPPHPSVLKPPMASPLKSSSTTPISMEGRMRSLQESPLKEKMRTAGEELQEDKLTISPLVDRSLDLFWFLKPCSLPSRK